MSIRFRRRIRIFPGFRINLSKSGLSASIGIRGANLTFGQQGTYLNVGIPGTGLYDRTRIDGKNQNLNDNNENVLPRNNNYLDTSEKEIKSFNPELLTSQDLFGLKESIINARKVKTELYHEYREADNMRGNAKILLILSKIFIFGFFIKWFDNNYQLKEQFSIECRNEYENFKLQIETNIDRELLNDYITLKNSFINCSNCNFIWDVTTTQTEDRVKTRSLAATSIRRQKVNFEISVLDFIDSQYEACKLFNANGGDLYFYPGFVLMLNKITNDFGLIDYRDLNVEYYLQNFIEEEVLPQDSQTVGSTWKYVNKNGSPDKRFANNYQIPIMQYSNIILNTDFGLNEYYMFSNSDAGMQLGKSLEKYLNSLKKLKWRADNTTNPSLPPNTCG